MVVDAASSRLFVPCPDTGAVLVLSASTGSQIGSIAVDSPQAVELAGSQLWVGSRDNPTLFVFDVSGAGTNFPTIAQVTLPAANAVGLKYVQQVRLVFLGVEGAFLAVDVETHKIRGPAKSPGAFTGLDVDVADSSKYIIATGYNNHVVWVNTGRWYIEVDMGPLPPSFPAPRCLYFDDEYNMILVSDSATGAFLAINADALKVEVDFVLSGVSNQTALWVDDSEKKGLRRVYSVGAGNATSPAGVSVYEQRAAKLYLPLGFAQTSAHAAVNVASCLDATHRRLFLAQDGMLMVFNLNQTANTNSGTAV